MSMEFNYQAKGTDIIEESKGGIGKNIVDPVKITFTIEMDKKHYESIANKQEIPSKILKVLNYKGF